MVRLLVSCSGSGTSKLLGFVPPGVSDQQGAVVLDEDVLDLLLALLIHVLLVVGDQGLGERLSDGVDLGHVTASLHADADVDVSKSVLAKKKHGLIDLDEALSPLGVGHSCGGLLTTEGLDRLDGLLLISHRCFYKNLEKLFSVTL